MPSPPAPHPLPLPETREGSHAPHTVDRLQKAGGMKARKTLNRTEKFLVA